MKPILDWLDHRTGYRAIVSESLYENIPGGSRWRYVWGSTLVFVFFVQVITGIFLWMAYSPSTQTAWESVYYLEYHLDGGWLLRGIHHYAAQLMMILMLLHVLQVIVDGAYKAPREVNFWFGLLLMLIIFGLGLTGYLLPWDQKGYWATKVATEIAGSMGRELPEIAVGGADYGTQTLTRFFAIHAGVLPALLIGLLVVHLALFRRHGITAKLSGRREGFRQDFWPDQVLKDAVACLAVLLVIVFLSWQFRAELGAPADAAENYAAARPEWYFLFLFQFLKYFPGEYGKLIGAVVLPGLLVGFMFLMPFVGRSRTGHRINIAFIALVMVGSGILTLLALDEDYYAARIDKKKIAEVEKAFAQIAIDLRKEGEGSPYHDKEQAEQLALYAGDDQERNDLLQKQLFRYQRYRTSENFIQAVHAAEVEAARVKELAVEWDPEVEAYLPSIPPTGALALLRADPKTQGPKLFGRYCASCHDYSGPDAEQTFASIHPLAPKTGEHLPNGAPNLYRFASREWVGGMLDPEEVAKVHLDRQTWTVTDAPYYGNTNIANEEGGMVEFVQSDLADLDEEGKAKLQSIVVALSADARLPYQAQVDHEAEGAGQIAAGRAAFSESFDSYACSDCHRWGTVEDADDAPDLTGYGSRAWTIKMIADPAHLYGEHNDRMPAFNPPDNPAAQQLSGKNIGLIVDWLRQDWPSASTPGSSGPSAAPGTH